MAHATTTIVSVLAERLDEAIEAIAARLAGAAIGDADAVHKARVASRRLREALAVSDAIAPESDAARTRRDIRRLTRALGPVREADVALDTLAAAAEQHKWRRTGIAAVRRRLDAERTRRRRRLPAKLHAVDIESLRARVAQVSEALGALSASDAWTRAIGQRVARRAEALGAAVRRCGTIYAPERLHAVRIAVKKLRYALEIAGASKMIDAAEHLTALQQAQEQFGQLHDLQILLGEVQGAAASVRRTALGEILESMVAALERDCRERHADALAGLPDLAARAIAVRQAAALLRAKRRAIKVGMARGRQRRVS